MKNNEIGQGSLLRRVRHCGRVGVSLFLLSMILGVLPPTPTAFASAQIPPTRIPVDSSVSGFYFLNATEALVLGTDHKLWLEHAPFGSVPPARTQIDGSVSNFFAFSDTEVLVLGTDQKLWLTHAPFGQLPPPRTQIDDSVSAFQALSDTEILVLGTDQKLWLTHAPFGHVPPPRTPVDSDVSNFHFVPGSSDKEILVLGTDQKLWLEHAPFGVVPPGRLQIDDSVSAFEGVNDTEVYVIGTDGNLWLEHAPFSSSNIPPERVFLYEDVRSFQIYTSILRFGGGFVVLYTDSSLWVDGGVEIDVNVSAFQQHFALLPKEVFVLDTSSNLWIEVPPFG
jgi:hypothetical protein